jgi:hypothetical protein
MCYYITNIAEYNKLIMNCMYCVICEKRMESHDSDFDPFKDDHNKINLSGGAIGQLQVNYGSKFDGDVLIIAICDKCITTKLNSHTLLYIDNYMFKSDIVSNDIDNSRKRYIRRVNIDKLLD